MAIQSSRLRISGLNSGMDTQSIVTSLMKLEQMKVDKQFQAVTRLQWKQDSYREVNNLLRAFKDDYSTVTKQAQNMLSQINYRTNVVKLQGESNAVTLTASSSALAGAGSVDYVTQLARGAGVEGAKITGGDTFNLNGPVASLLGEDAKYHYNGKEGNYTFTFDEDKHKGKSVEELKALIAQAMNGEEVEGVDARLVKAEYFSFSIGTKADGSANTFTFHKDVSLSTVISTVNANTDANATLSFSQLTGKFTLTSKTTGEQSELTFNDAAPAAETLNYDITYQWKKLDEEGKVTARTDFSDDEKSGLDASKALDQVTDAVKFFTDGLQLTPGTATNGQNAILSINGHEITRSSNRFTVDGVTYALNRTFNESKSEEGKLGYTVSQDVDSTFNMIKGYIDAYNTLIAKFNRGGETSTTGLTLNDGKAPGLLNEKVYRAYAPLTEEEKASLSESQIEKWEKLAKSGTLRNDAALSGLVSQLRSHFYSPLGDSGKIMANIGLTTTANYMDGGQIQINETKLRNAIAQNPEEVYQMFAGTGDAGGTTGSKGLVRKINDSINAYVKQNEQYTLAYNTEALRKADSRLTEMQQKLYEIEERYWAKFTAMEQALAKLNSQSGWLSAQLGSAGSQ